MTKYLVKKFTVLKKVHVVFIFYLFYFLTNIIITYSRYKEETRYHLPGLLLSPRLPLFDTYAQSRTWHGRHHLVCFSATLSPNQGLDMEDITKSASLRDLRPIKGLTWKTSPRLPLCDILTSTQGGTSRRTVVSDGRDWTQQGDWTGY